MFRLIKCVLNGTNNAITNNSNSVKLLKSKIYFYSIFFIIGIIVSDEGITSDCPLDHGTFRNKTKCNAYYTCISNKVVAAYECPEGFNFNDVR